MNSRKGENERQMVESEAESQGREGRQDESHERASNKRGEREDRFPKGVIEGGGL